LSSLAESEARQNGQELESVPEDRGPASFRRQLEAVKEGARIEVVAQDYGEFKLAGSERLLGRCLSPGHEDRTASLTIFTEDQRFKCFGIGCGAHGDVLDLVMLAEGCELWEAMMILSTRYGIQLPGRPPAWFRKQERQATVRNIVREAIKSSRRRRFFRWVILPTLEGIADEEERRAEIKRTWAEFEAMMREEGL
jgi:DNA primase